MARKNRVSRQTSRRTAGRNMISERTPGLGEVIVVTSRRRLRSAQVAGCIATLRRQRPDLPVRRTGDGGSGKGFNVHVDTDTSTLWIECPGVQNWTRSLDVTAFPAGLQVAVFGATPIFA
jgi:hypothetical protein